MANLLLTILTIAYAGVGIVATIGYWPTIKDLIARKPSANIASYIVWTSTAGVTFLYSIFILTDNLFRFVSGLNFLSCATILVLSLRPGVCEKKIGRRVHTSKKNHNTD